MNETGCCGYSHLIFQLSIDIKGIQQIALSQRNRIPLARLKIHDRTVIVKRVPKSIPWAYKEINRTRFIVIIKTHLKSNICIGTSE